MTKELDRRFRHVGRIKRSWGTTHKPTQRRLNEMMTVLFETGRLDILRQIQSGELSPLQVYDAYRTNDLNRLPTAATMAPLKESMEKWITKKECSEAHRRSLMQSLRHLLKSSGQRSTVSVLPTLLIALREKMQGKHPRSFNLARAAAQAFVKSTQGKNSKLWAEVSNVEVLKVTPSRHRHPLTPSELREITAEIDWRIVDMVWSMATTGMGPSEYWGKWERREDRVEIHGTKRSGRERVVPAIVLISQPHFEYAAFRRHLRDASDNQVTPYDLRRSYANWLESAGIPRTRRKLYLGHGSTDVTSLYEWHEVTAFLAEDAAKLRAYVFGTEKQSLKLVEK